MIVIIIVFLYFFLRSQYVNFKVGVIDCRIKSRMFFLIPLIPIGLKRLKEDIRNISSSLKKWKIVENKITISKFYFHRLTVPRYTTLIEFDISDGQNGRIPNDVRDEMINDITSTFKEIGYELSSYRENGLWINESETNLKVYDILMKNLKDNLMINSISFKFFK